MLRLAPVTMLFLVCLVSPSFGDEKKLAFDPDKLVSLLGAKPLKPGADADDLQKKLVERYNTGVRIYELQLAAFKLGRATASQLIQGGKLVLDAELALKDKPADRVVVLEKIVTLAQMNESVVELLVNVGTANPAALETARYERIGAEIELLKEKKAPSSRK